MLAEKACDGLRELVLRLACGRLALGADEDHEPECVALGDDGRGDGRAVAVERLGDEHAALARHGAVDTAVLHDLLELRADALADKVAARAARRGDDAVAVGHGHARAGRLAQRVAQLCGKLVHAAHERVLLKNDLPVLARVDLQRIALADAHSAADLLGNDNAAKVVPLCQVGAKKFYKLSEKPLISMTLGFPDGATMHLRGFDRLCYFRSKFDRFAPK